MQPINGIDEQNRLDQNDKWGIIYSWYIIFINIGCEMNEKNYSCHSSKGDNEKSKDEDTKKSTFLKSDQKGQKRKKLSQSITLKALNSLNK